MNCLFTLRHKRTGNIINIYGYTDIYFLVWNVYRNEFQRIKTSEFEPCESDLTGGDYLPE